MRKVSLFGEMDACVRSSEATKKVGAAHFVHQRLLPLCRRVSLLCVCVVQLECPRRQ